MKYIEKKQFCSYRNKSPTCILTIKLFDDIVLSIQKILIKKTKKGYINEQSNSSYSYEKSHFQA